ncbi:MAG: hypothetical protein KatS3mg053_1899 [Candidatus Roseilinea sp.]|nr:MAG: hypothetical protein KatS3mg053_1899 [Candidatus Roseilinea sp.]
MALYSVNWRKILAGKRSLSRVRLSPLGSIGEVTISRIESQDDMADRFSPALVVLVALLSVLIGTYFIVAGARGVIRRTVTYRMHAYIGTAAVIVGVMMVCLGVGSVCAGINFMFDRLAR